MDTGFNDKYSYGVKTRKVTISRGNRQGNMALIEEENPPQLNKYEPENKHDIPFLTKIRRTRFMHDLVITNCSFQSWIKTRFYTLVEVGNVDMAAFIAKLLTKHGGYGFNQYHLMALLLDFDPKEELAKEKEKENKQKSKIEDENQPEKEPMPAIQTETNLNPLGQMNPVEAPSGADYKPNVINFGQPFLTKQEQINLLKKMRKANMTKKPHDNMAITPMHCVCINPNPLALKHFIDVGGDLYVYDLELRKPVHYAACSSTADNLRVLKAKGVDLRDTDKHQKTPLMFACQHGRLENVKFILENTETNIDQKCKLARGPIHFAAENGHLGNAQLTNRRGQIFTRKRRQHRNHRTQPSNNFESGGHERRLSNGRISIGSRGQTTENGQIPQVCFDPSGAKRAHENRQLATTKRGLIRQGGQLR